MRTINRTRTDRVQNQYESAEERDKDIKLYLSLGWHLVREFGLSADVAWRKLMVTYEKTTEVYRDEQ